MVSIREDIGLRSSVLNWLFYVGLFLCLLGGQRFSPTGLMPIPINRIQLALRRIGEVLLALRLLSLFPRYPRYTFTCLCLLFLFLVPHRLAGRGTMNLFRLTLVVAASRDADLKTSLKVYLAYLVFFLVIGPATSALGWTRPVFTHLGGLRGASYGLSNPNSLAAFLAIAVFLGLYLSGKRSPVVVFGVCWSVAALSFFLTLCLTQTLLLFLLPVFYVVFQKAGPKGAWPLCVLPVVCLAVSVLLSCYYGPGYGSNTFESRFSIPALVYERFGLSLFGQDCGLFEWFKGQDPPNLALDNAYLNLFLCCGILPGLASMASLCILMLLVGKKGDALLAAIACCFVCSGMAEKIPFNIGFCFLPLFFIPLLEEAAPASGRAVSVVSAALALGAAVYALIGGVFTGG